MLSRVSVHMACVWLTLCRLSKRKKRRERKKCGKWEKRETVVAVRLDTEKDSSHRIFSRLMVVSIGHGLRFGTTWTHARKYCIRKIRRTRLKKRDPNTCRLFFFFNEIKLTIYAVCIFPALNKIVVTMIRLINACVLVKILIWFSMWFSVLGCEKCTLCDVAAVLLLSSMIF